MLFHATDAGRARQLTDLLAGAGVTVAQDSLAGTDADALVVFLSAASLTSPDWRARAATLMESASRLIPLRIGEIDDSLVPPRLGELNWIYWQPDNVRVTFGYVAAGLFSDPSRRLVSRQLSHEAQAWMQSGRRAELLIADYPRARRMMAVLRDLEADRLAAPTPAMKEFVQRSVKFSGPKYRRRRNGRILAIVGTAAALLVAAVLVPEIKLASFNNKESVVVTGNPALLGELPEWSAANAAALLTDGTPAERQLARVTLLRALNEPWELDALQWQQVPSSSVPFDHGRLAVISVDLGLAIIKVKTQHVVWAAAAPGGPYGLSAAPDGRTAIGISLSGPGAIVINLDQHTTRRVAVNTAFAGQLYQGDAVLGSDGIAAIMLPGSRIGELNTDTGSIKDLGTYPPILGLSAWTSQGTATALVRAGSGRVGSGRAELIALPGRRVLASFAGMPAFGVGAVSPDGRQAVVQGGDGQFWEIGVGQRPRPTGIPVPRVLNSVAWVAGERIVVSSDDQFGQVYYLPRGEPLGVVCAQVPRLLGVIPDVSSDVVACGGEGGTDFWRLPAGPLPHREPGEATAQSWTSGPVTVTTSGPQLDVRAPGLNTGMFQPLGADISVVDVPRGGQYVLAGDGLGEVAVIEVERGYTQVVDAWNDPDHSQIVALGWNGGPVATTASGQTWRVTYCAGCGTDAGLVRAFRARITGCFSIRQLSYMGTGTWQRLGLHECTAQPGVPAPLTSPRLGGN